MKPIHLACSFDPIDSKPFRYIQVIRGRLIATNRRILVVLPASEIFGSKDIISKDEELYFDASLWKTSGILKSKYVTREGNLFTGGARPGDNFQIKALSKDEFLETTNGLPYPNIKVVFPQTEQIAIKSIAINSESFKIVYKIFGVDHMQTLFYGENKPLALISDYSDGIALIMATSTEEALENPLDFDRILGLKEPEVKRTDEANEDWEGLL